MKTLSYLFVFLTVLLSSCVDVQEKISKYDVNKEINVDEDYAPILDEIKSTYAKECIIGMLNDQNKSSYITFGIFTSYTIDFNYSPYLNFSENSFVKAGIGAVRGIKKCFICYGDCFEDAIHYVQDNFYELQHKYGFLAFKPLPNHLPTLIDLQNYASF